MHYLLIKIYVKDLKVGKIKEKIYIKYELSTPPHQNFASPRPKNITNAYIHSNHQVE